MRPRFLATLVLLPALLAGCVDAPTRDELPFPVLSRLNGVEPDDDGNMTLVAGPGLVVAPASNNTTVEVALAPVAFTHAFHACAQTCIDVEVPLGAIVADTAVFSLGNASLNADGPEGDSALHFFDDGSETARWLRWADEAGEFRLNDDLALDGNLTALGEMGSRRVVTLPLGGSEERVLVNTAVPEGHEAIMWARGSDRLVNGTALVRLPPLFAYMTDPDRVTAHVTLTSKGAGLWVSQRANFQLRVESVADDGSDATFDWYVMAPRRGSDYQP